MAVIENEVARRVAARAAMKGGPDGLKALAMAEQDRDALLAEIVNIERGHAEELEERRLAGDAAYGDVCEEKAAVEKELAAAEKRIKLLELSLKACARTAGQIRVHLEYNRPGAAQMAVKRIEGEVDATLAQG